MEPHSSCSLPWPYTRKTIRPQAITRGMRCLQPAPVTGPWRARMCLFANGAVWHACSALMWGAVLACIAARRHLSVRSSSLVTSVWARTCTGRLACSVLITSGIFSSGGPTHSSRSLPNALVGTRSFQELPVSAWWKKLDGLHPIS